MSKVFCLGLGKTGTTSMAVALSKLGYKVAGYHDFRDFAKDKDVTFDALRARAKTIDFDAAQDDPWPSLYKFLDEDFPGSKFIHVERPADRWIKSAVTDYETHDNEIHRLIFGTLNPVGHEDMWRDAYIAHNQAVRAHFEGREDYLYLRLEDVGWEPICAFLGKPVPGEPWPHANKKSTKYVMKLWWKIRDRLFPID